jgi:hypothetical protein
MTTSPLARKLQLKPGQRALLVNAPPGYRSALEPLPADVELAEDGEGPFDFVQAFTRNRKELEEVLPRATAAVKPDALLWLTYPKGGARAGTDLNRDILWASVAPHGLAGVSLIAVDGMWSAMRFRPADRVGR